MSSLNEYNIPGLDSDNEEKKENENNNGKIQEIVYVELFPIHKYQSNPYKSYEMYLHENV